ncbi:MAG: ATP-binding protein [Sodaliphilus sp.]|nr:ATP-binding protein [Sodaliphilus sp.]
MNTYNEIILEPDPARVMEGLRDTGYDFNMAMADLVDNSIAANASVVKVYLNPMPNSELKLYIADNGCGMTMEGLMNAMRYGSNRRADASSLGKFGLGLKTASTAFCRSLSLLSRGTDGKCNKVCWDLDEICKINKWKLLQPAITDDEMDLLDDITDGKTGTLVIWEKIDRLLKDYQRDGAKKTALKKILENLRFHFAMVYQRFLDPQYTETPITIYLNDVPVEPWDPFCLAETETTCTGHQVVRAELPEGGFSQFTLNAYVLPRKEKFSSLEAYSKANINNDMQGFYIYRENRLLHYGDWGAIRRKDPHFSLARVELSFDHTLDEAFNVDIKKSRIHINVDIADYLEKQFLPATIREAEERYRKIKQDVAKKGGGDAHDASGMNIAQNAKALEGSKTEIVNAKTNEVKVTNKGGQFTATIKILPPTNKKQHRVALVDSIDGNLLWEPSIVNGEHAVSINRNHDFYTKVYGPNIENADLIQGLDSLLWGLAEAEMSTFNDFTREQYEEMRNQVSHILKKLVKDLDDPESDD